MPSFSTTVFVALVAVLIALFATPIRHNLPFKARLFAHAIHYEAFCDDLLPRSPLPPNPIEQLKKSKNKPVRRTLLMIRHSESEWNTMANATLPLPTRIANIASAFSRELALLMTSAAPDIEKNSIFYDASISDLGWNQSTDFAKIALHPSSGKVATWLKKNENEKRPVKLITSNLRRSIETALLSLRPILDSDPKQHLHVDSALQECCTKVDALSFQEEPGKLDTTVLLKNRLPWDRVQPTHNVEGNKQLGKSSVWKRHDIFLNRLFGDKSSQDAVHIVVGHSAWFRRFFWRFAAASAPEDSLVKQAGRKKFENCAAAAVEVVVDPETRIPVIGKMEFLHGGLA